MITPSPVAQREVGFPVGVVGPVVTGRCVVKSFERGFVALVDGYGVIGAGVDGRFDDWSTKVGATRGRKGRGFPISDRPEITLPSLTVKGMMFRFWRAVGMRPESMLWDSQSGLKVAEVANFGWDWSR